MRIRREVGVDMQEKEEKSPHHNTTKKIAVQYRSNLRRAIREISAIEFEIVHLKMLKEYCPFWSLLDLIISGDITEKTSQQSHMELKKIIKNFDRSKNAINLGGMFLKITQHDIEQIFGISGGKEKILLENTKKLTNSSLQRRFTGLNGMTLEQMTLKHISANLKAACSGTSKEDIEDVPKLITLFLLAVLFVPTRSYHVSWRYINYVNDLKKIKDYDWSGHIFQRLHSSLCQTKDPENVSGCTMALPYWVMNNFDICPMNDDAHLWCHKWNLEELAKATKLAPIEAICLSKNQVEGSKRRLSPSVQRKNPSRGLGCNTERAVSQCTKNTQSCEKSTKPVETSESFKARFPQAMDSTRENQVRGSKQRLAQEVQRKNSATGQGCDKEKGVSQRTEKSQIKNIMKAVDERCDSFKVLFTQAMESAREQNQLKANNSAAVEKALNLTHSNGWLRETESDTENGLNVVDESPVEPSFESSIRSSEFEKQQTQNGQSKHVPVEKPHTVMVNDTERAVSRSAEKARSNKISKAVDAACSDRFIVMSPQAMESKREFVAKANSSAAVKKVPIITNSNVWPRENESGTENDLNVVFKSPVEPCFDSSIRRSELENQRTQNEKLKRVPVDEAHTVIEIDDESETEREADKKGTALRDTKRSMFVPQNILQENSEEYQPKANASAATEIGPIIPNSDGCLRENNSEKQQIRNEQFKRVPVVEAHTIIEIYDESETEKKVENKIAHERDPKRLRLSPQNIVHEKVEPQFVFDFKDFKIEVDGKTIDFPQQVREDYFKLCCRKSYLHRHLTKGINRKLAALIISGTVNITNEIRDSKISSEEKVAYWLTALRGFKVFGMDIGFVRERVNQLSGLVMNSKIFKEVKIEPDKIERDRIQKEIIELGKKKRKLDDEIKGKEKVDANYEVTYEEAASAPW